MADTATMIERVPWEAARARMDWDQGEHVTLIGPTGRGKTELIVSLQDLRPYCLFLSTKRVDDTQKHLTGYRKITDPAQLEVDVSPRFMFRPAFPRVSAATLRKQHQHIYREILSRAYRQTGWTIIADELRYITDFLGLTDEMLLLWLQGRSQGNTVVCGTQRPRHVPLEAYDQATHLFFWNNPDKASLERIAEIASLDRRLVLSAVPQLPHHDVMYVNAVSGDMFITNTRA